MKLRNLMYATMIACAFASCSSDDVPAPEQPQPQPEAGEGATTLTVKYDKAAITKASGDISSLSMLVFDAEDKLEVIGTTEDATSVESPGGGDAVAHAVLTPGVKSVALIANYAVVASKGDPKNTVLASTKVFDESEAGANPTMNSKLYTGVVVAANTKNVLGFSEEPIGYKYVGGFTAGSDDLVKPVKLYRNVAKVVLESVSVKVTKDSNKPKYSNPQLLLKEVFILQGHEKTMLMGKGKDENGADVYGTEYGATNVGDAWFSAYKHTDHTPDWIANDGKHPLAETGVSVVPNGTDGKLPAWILQSINPNETVVAGSTKQLNKSFYVYENTDINTDATLDYRTLLVVKGDFAYTTENGIKTEENRYYTIALGKDFKVKDANALNLLKLCGVAAEDATIDGSAVYNGLYCNLQYNLTLTVTGPGYQTPGGGGDPTTLDVQCVVVDWGHVTQDVEI